MNALRRFEPASKNEKDPVIRNAKSFARRTTILRVKHLEVYSGPNLSNWASGHSGELLSKCSHLWTVKVREDPRSRPERWSEN
jgi:hypothetical protein